MNVMIIRKLPLDISLFCRTDSRHKVGAQWKKRTIMPIEIESF